MNKECFDSIRELAELKDVSDDVIYEFVNAAEKLKEAAAKDPALGPYRKRVMKELEEMKERSVQERLKRLSNTRKAGRRAQFYRQFKDRPMEGMLSALGGAINLAKNGLESVAHRADVMVKQYDAMLINGLEREGVLEVAKAGELQREIYVELFEMRTGGSPGKSGSAIAQKIARVIRTVHKGLKDDFDRSQGAPSGEIDGYITKQIHDRDRILEGHTDKESAFKKWVSEILPRLDKEKTFGPMMAGDEAKMIASLKGSFESIMTGVSAEGEGRSLHFLDGEKAFEYNELFGNRNILEATVERIRTLSRISAMQEFFGTDPRKAFETDMKNLERASRGNAKAELNFATRRGDVENLFEDVQGWTNIPGKSMKAKIGRTLRAWNTLTYLGAAGVRAVGNISLAATEIRNQTGQNIFSSHAEVMKTIFEQVLRGNKRDAMLFAHNIRDDLGALVSQFSDDLHTPGALARGQNLFMKLTGLNYINNLTRNSVSNMLASKLAAASDVRFGELDARMRANLQRAGINESEWEILRASVDEMPDGRKMITPEKIAKFDSKLADEVVKATKRKDVRHGKELVRKVELQYLGFLADAGNIATSSPGARTSSLIRRGTTEDDWGGQLLRTAGQFKSFSFYMHSVATRTLTSDPNKSAEHLLDMFKGKGDFKGMAGFITSATLMYYVSQQAINYAKGKPLDDPEDPSIWLRYALKSGALGLYGDMLDAENGYMRSASEWAAGPSAARVFDAIEIAIESAQGTDKSQKLAQSITNAIPGQNLFYTKRAMDYLILDNINEFVNPGYKDKQELKKLRANYADSDSSELKRLREKYKAENE